MSDEPEAPEGEEEEAPEGPPAGYIPGASDIAGQSVGDRGEVETHPAESAEEAEPAEA
jgi:hypothetical protein